MTSSAEGEVESSSETMHGIDVDTGEQVWQFGSEMSHVWVTSDAVVAATSDSTVEVRDLATGEERFHKSLPVDRTGNVQVTDDYLVMLGEKSDGGARDLVTVDIETGDEVQTTQVTESDSTALSVPQQPAQSFGAQFAGGFERLTRTTDSTQALVHQGGSDKEYLAVDLESGDVKWVLPESEAGQTLDGVLPTLLTGENIVAGPVRDEKTCSYSFYSEDSGSGEPNAVRVPGYTCSSVDLAPQNVGDLAYVVGDDGHPSLINVLTGKTMWTSKDVGTPGFFDGDVAMYIQNGDESGLTTVDVASDEVSWDVPVDGDAYVDVDAPSDSRLLTTRHLLLSRITAEADDNGDVINGTQAYGRDTGALEWTYPGLAVAFDDAHYLFVEGLGRTGTDEVTLSMVSAE